MTNIKIDAQRLYRALAATNYARSGDKGRPLLTTFYFDTEREGELILVATDSYRLGRATLKLGQDESVTGESFMLSCDAKSILSILKPCTGIIELNVGTDGMACLMTANSAVTFDTLHGTYPDYRQLIPFQMDDANTAVAYNPAYISDAGKAALVFSGQTAKRATSPVSFHHDGASRPGMFTIKNAEDSFDYLLMPVRVQ